MHELGERNICYLMVEGGAAVNTAMLEAKLVDKLFCFIAPKIIGGAKSVSAISGAGVTTVAEALTLRDAKYEQIGVDILVRGYCG